MNKKILGIKVSTILTAAACLVIAVLIWMFVKYDMDKHGAAAIGHSLSALRNYAK